MISAYLLQSAILDKNYLNLLDFYSRITFILTLQPGNLNMLAVPLELARRYEARLTQQNIVARQRPHYHKWLRY